MIFKKHFALKILKKFPPLPGRELYTLDKRIQCRNIDFRYQIEIPKFKKPALSRVSELKSQKTRVLKNPRVRKLKKKLWYGIPNHARDSTVRRALDCLEQISSAQCSHLRADMEEGIPRLSLGMEF